MRVAVVGLGPAGCRAAMLLARAGVDTTLFEARDRVGGRMHTIQLDDGFYEAGAEWIDRDHHRVIDLLAELNQQPSDHGMWPGNVWYRGSRSDEESLWPDVQKDVARVEEAADYLCADLEPDPWENFLYPNLDQQTLGKFLDSQCLSARGRWWMEAIYRSDEGEDTDKTGLLGWLCGRLNDLDRDKDAMSAYRFPEGAQRFCERMIESTGLTPHFGSVLKRVEMEGDLAILYFETHHDSFDRVILTLPPPALRRVVFDPPLYDIKEAAIGEIGMSRVIKIALEFESKFWVGTGWKGRGFSDKPIQQFWDSSRGDAAVISAYICGNEAEILRKDPYAVEQTLGQLDTMLPGAKASFKSGRVSDWISEPYSCGGFPYLPPNYALGPMSALFGPDRRIHFAGDATTLRMGFVEGALESAERAVQEVLNA